MKKKNVLWTLVGMLLLFLLASSVPAVTDHYFVKLDETGQVAFGGGSGFNGGEWFYYPFTNWWNEWFYNDPYTPQRMKKIYVSLDIIPTGMVTNAYVEIAYNWSTGRWSEMGYPFPPLPPYIPDPSLEELYIQRSTFFAGQVFEPIHIEDYFEIVEYNPEWVSIDIRGYNVEIVQGVIDHNCVERITPPVEPIKWAQPPVPYPTAGDLYHGWDEKSILSNEITPTREQFVADDFYCLGPKPVTGITWWGSFLGYQGTIPPQQSLPRAFQIAFWTDVPAGVDAEFSHPGKMIHEIFCENFTMEFFGWDMNPWTGAQEAKYRFSQEFTEAEWFHQWRGDRVYWVSIAAIYPEVCECNGDLNGDGVIDLMDLNLFNACLGALPPLPPQCVQADLNCDGRVDSLDMVIMQCQLAAGWPDPACCQSVVLPPPDFPWGWETRPHYFNDDAVRIIPNQGVPHLGYHLNVQLDMVNPIYGPDQQSWDLTYVLHTDPQYIKWDQHFDPTWLYNKDIPSMATWYPDGTIPVLHTIVADDWLCDTQWPIVSIEWWGSYLGYHGEPGPVPPLKPDYFLLSIWTDMPAGTAYPYSSPGQLLWRYDAYNFVEVPVGTESNGEMVYKYFVNLPPTNYFYQEGGPDKVNIYWLSVVAVYSPTVQIPYPWGWTNHRHVFNDDAVMGDPIGAADPWLIHWMELFDPEGNSADMSFVLETAPECQCYGDLADSTGLAPGADGVVDFGDINYLANELAMAGWNINVSDRPDLRCADMADDTGLVPGPNGRINFGDINYFANKLSQAGWRIPCPPGIPIR